MQVLRGCRLSGSRPHLAAQTSSADLLRRQCQHLRSRSHCTLSSFHTLTAQASASDAPESNAAQVKAALAQAGLSEDAITHVVTQYPFYLNWDVLSKMIPAIQMWQQELGPDFVSELRRVPHLLRRSSETQATKRDWLASLGVKSLSRMEKICPDLLGVSLKLLQSRVAFLVAMGFTQLEVCLVVQQHPDILTRTSELVEDVLMVINQLFIDRGEQRIASVLLDSKSRTLFGRAASLMHDRMLHFRTLIGTDQKAFKRAWRAGVFAVPVAEMDLRARLIAQQVAVSPTDAISLVRRCPQLLTQPPSRVALHIRQFHALGFTDNQVKDICQGQPPLLNRDWETQVQKEKWGFLTCILQLYPQRHCCCTTVPHILFAKQAWTTVGVFATPTTSWCADFC